MISFLYSLFDSYELLKALIIACIIVFLLRMWAFGVKDRTEQEEKVRQQEMDGKIQDIIIPVSSTIYDEHDCLICKRPIWNREGIEIEKGQTVELKCTHRYHWKCLNRNPSSPSVDESSYVMVNNVTRCPACHFQPDVIEALPLHKWQTVRYWVLLIDDALDQLASRSGKYGICWAEVRSRARKMSGLSLEQLRRGEEQTFGAESIDAEEDLDGPGKFPYFAALKDSRAERFYDYIDDVYHRGAGKWITYQSSQGGERMVFKYSWGVPPYTTCQNCHKSIDSTDLQHTAGIDCKVCGHICNKKLYWCSEECFATHAMECKKNVNILERFKVQKSC